VKINEIEELKKIYTKAKSKNKNLYASVICNINIDMIKGELTFVKSVSEKSFRIFRPLNNSIIEIETKNLGSFNFIY